MVRPAVLYAFDFPLGRDYTDFMEDLEEDATLRQNINIFKGMYIITVAAPYVLIDGHMFTAVTMVTDPRKLAVEADPDMPQISLEEMLDDLQIAEDATGGEGALMQD